MSRNLDWMADASCRDHPNPDDFFPSIAGQGARIQIAAARRICAACPVQTQCGAHRGITGATAGVWGDATEPPRPHTPTQVRVTPQVSADRGRYVRGARDQTAQAANAAYNRAYVQARRKPKSCDTCGGDVRGSGRHRFCSTDCRIVARHPGSWRAARVKRAAS